MAVRDIQKFVKEYYASGATKRVMSFIGGIQEGPTVNYYESGAVQKKMEYVDGQIEGVAREFYESGELWVEEIYRRGQLQGVVKSFYKNGTTQSELPYVEGLLHGNCRVFYGSGILKKEGRFRKGKQLGRAKIYEETGGLKRKGDFFSEEDERDEVMYEKGTKAERVSGSKLFMQFLVLMVLIGVVAYVFDPEHGVFKGEEKEKVQQELRSLGQSQRDPMLPPPNPPDGIVKTYYPSGELYAEWTFLGGKQHGPTRKYFKQGSLKSEINYQSGVLDGRSIIYHESGRVISDNLYKDGMIVRDEDREEDTKQVGNRIMVRQNNAEYDDSAFDESEDEKSG